MTSSSSQMAVGVIFDIRGVARNDPKFISSAQALYETALLAHSLASDRMTHLSLVVLGAKGYEPLLSAHSLATLDMPFKRAFWKLKQVISFHSQDAIYSCLGSFGFILTEMASQLEPKPSVEMVVITTKDEESILKDVEAFLYKTRDNPQLKLTVLHMAPTGHFQVDHSINGSFKTRLTWVQVNGPEMNVHPFFKKWLTVVKKNWKLCGEEDWSVDIDVEGASVEQFVAGQDENEGENILKLVEWIQMDGLPAELLYGPPRRLLPAGGDDSAVQLGALSSWLRKRNAGAIARLMPNDKDLFAIFPESGASLLMRNIAARQLILPGCPTAPQPVEQSAEDDIIFMEVRSACRKIPQVQRPIEGESCGILKAIEAKVDELNPLNVAKPGAAPSRKRPRRC